MKRIVFLTFFGLLYMNTMATIFYTVSFDDAKAHYANISIRYTPQGSSSMFKVPVWTPGSYKVREFSLNYTVTAAQADGKRLDVERLDKNSWKILHEGVSGEVVLSYKLYAFTVSTRESYVDEYYAFLHGPSAFGYIETLMNEEINLAVKAPVGWKNTEIAMVANSDGSFTFPNYDLLADSPLAVGDFDVSDFKSGGVPHRIVMIGDGNYDLNRVTKDIKTVCDQEVKMFGDHPSDYYVHFIQNTTSGSGGLEHLNCQTSNMYRWGYTDEKRYKEFLALVAHEYFHLWNVKRIRPEALGPFDYDKENYTTMLWIAEGVTSYYDDLTLLRSGIINKQEYLELAAKQITRYENTPGRTEMNLEESSKLAWIKAYLPNENSYNTTISYYNKGMLMAWLLDLSILRHSKGKQRLDDVMRTLYDNYKTDGKGFTYAVFKSVCEKKAGVSLDELFNEVVKGTEVIDYAHFLNDFNVKLEGKTKESPWSGVSSKVDAGRTTIVRILANSPAEKAGLSVNDEIIAVNGWRLNTSLEDHESTQKAGNTLTLWIARDGALIEKQVTLTQDPTIEFSLTLDKENDLQACWLKD